MRYAVGEGHYRTQQVPGSVCCDPSFHAGPQSAGDCRTDFQQPHGTSYFLFSGILPGDFQDQLGIGPAGDQPQQARHFIRGNRPVGPVEPGIPFDLIGYRFAGAKFPGGEIGVRRPVVRRHLVYLPDCTEEGVGYRRVDSIQGSELV